MSSMKDFYMRSYSCNGNLVHPHEVHQILDDTWNFAPASIDASKTLQQQLFKKSHVSVEFDMNKEIQHGTCT